MEREQSARRRPAPELGPDARRVAERLQQLSVGEAERVLERAIDLQVNAPGADPAETLNTDVVARIAAELDIDQRHLRQALLEELFRVEVEEPGLLDRLIVPDAITAHGPVGGDQQSVRRTLDDWMINHEGMRKRAENAAATAWEKDQGFGAVIRKAMQMSRGKRALRSAAGVTSAVRPATDEQQVVVLEADTSNLRRMALSLLGAAALAGGAVAITTGAIDPSGFGLDNTLAGLSTTALLGGGVLIGVKMWAERIRQGLGRALDAVRSPHLVEKGTSLPSTVRRWVDQVRGTADDIRNEYRR